VRHLGVAIVSEVTDSLAKAVATSLKVQGVWTEEILPAALGDVRIVLRDDSLFVNGGRMGGIFFRASSDSNFSQGFVTEDRSFSDAEVRATWLAALNLQSIVAINRYDATAWFEGLRWTVWRRKLLQAGIPVCDFTFGDVQTEHNVFWHPYTSDVSQSAPERSICRVLGSAISPSDAKHVSFAVCNQIISGCPKANLLATVRALSDVGVGLAEITTDSDDRILSVNPQPIILEPECLKRAVDLIVGFYYAHLGCG
jgi:hypothetical protein